MPGEISKIYPPTESLLCPSFTQNEKVQTVVLVPVPKVLLKYGESGRLNRSDFVTTSSAAAAAAAGLFQISEAKFIIVILGEG